MKNEKAKKGKHVAGFVDAHGRILQWRMNDLESCAERHLFEDLPRTEGRLVVVRARKYIDGVRMMPSQPCGKCVDVLREFSPPSVKRVVWSSIDGHFESCRPCDLPDNEYRARNAPRV